MKTQPGNSNTTVNGFTETFRSDADSCHYLCRGNRGAQGKSCLVCYMVLFIQWASFQSEFTCLGQSLTSATRRQSGYFAACVDSLRQIRQRLASNPEDFATWLAASSLSTHLGTRCKPADRIIYYNDALYFAEQAIGLNAHNKEARLQRIIAWGLLATITEESREKLWLAKSLRLEIDFLLSLDSLYAPAHFVLGKWHLSLSKLSWVQQVACRLAGGLPEAPSLAKALRHFNKSVQLEPGNILFLYNKALTLQELGRTEEALQVVLAALKQPARESDDEIRKDNCRALLIQLESRDR